MKKGWMIALLLVTAGTTGWAEERMPAAPAIDDPRFEFLKQLEGTWIGETEIAPGQQGVFEFRVTAGGTAVEEREMIGTPMEMLTVYHMQGDSLVATHYCMLGNQPHMVAAPRVVDRSLSFGCDGKPGNTRSHNDEHVHGWTMRLADDGRLHYDAELIADGKVTEAPTSVLTRQATTAGR